MNTLRLSEDNMKDYSSFLDPDVAENLERIFYRGLITTGDDRDPVGAMVWRLVNMESDDPVQAQIEWLKTDSEEVAAVLLDAFKEEIDKENVVKTTFTLPVSQGRFLRPVLKNAGFSVKLFEGDSLVTSIGEMKKMPIIDTKIPLEGVFPLSNMRMRDFRREINRCTEAGRKGVCEDLSYLPMSYFDSEISTYVEKNGEVQGMQLYHKTPSGNLEIDLLIAWGKDFKLVFAQLFKLTLLRAIEIYPDDTRIILNRHNEAALLLTEKLFPRGLGSPIYTGERKEIQ